MWRSWESLASRSARKKLDKYSPGAAAPGDLLIDIFLIKLLSNALDWRRFGGVAFLDDYIFWEYGGPDGELTASLRYLSQRFTMPDNMGKALLTDIGTEELAHLEIIGSIVGQLTDGEGARSFDKYGKADYYVDHANGVYAANAAGVPFTAAYFQVKADPIADIVENMAAEQKARATYDNILRLSDDPDVNEVIRFLRQREVVHFQRFGELLNHYQSQIKC